MAEVVFDSLDEELNVQSKRTFHKWLLKAINEKDKVLFKHCLEVLGKSWNVKRTVPKRIFEHFVDYLWKKSSDIVDGKYNWYLC